VVWQSGAVCGHSNETGGTADFADANSDCYGTSTFNTELRSPSFDLTGYGTAELQFKSAYENYGGNDYARVWASGNGGTTWDLLLQWNGDQSGPQTITLDLTPYTGSADVMLSFQYDSNGLSGWYWYWQIDDVIVTGIGGADLVITKQDSPDPAVRGEQVTYTVRVTNSGPHDAQDVVVTDTLPAELSLVDTEGCAEDPNGVPTCTLGTILATGANFKEYTINASIAPGPDVSVQNEASVTSTTPLINTGDDSVSETTTLQWLPANLTGTKTVSGQFMLGGTIFYTVVLSNAGPGDLPDNPGDEFVDVLPRVVALTNATVSSGGGTATADIPSNTVTWNGSLAAGAEVTLQIEAWITGAVVNQGVINRDSDGDGVYDTQRLTNDPSTSAPDDPTVFELLSQHTVPAVSTMGLLALVVALAITGAMMINRRRRLAHHHL
jgi:uncharacterized repeat protein (TIGR01451 family)